MAVPAWSVVVPDNKAYEDPGGASYDSSSRKSHSSRLVGPPDRQHDSIFITASLNYFNASSNYAEFKGKQISMLGAGCDIQYYFPGAKLKQMFGISADYTGIYQKLGGDTDADFMLHRATASLRGRFFLANYGGKSFIFGLKGGYHYVYKQKLRYRGAYYYLNLYSPMFGIFMSDAIFYRMTRNIRLKPFEFEISFNYFYMLEGLEGPSVYDVYAGFFCDINNFRIGLGYNLYFIQGSVIHEYYHAMVLKIGCYF